MNVVQWFDDLSVKMKVMVLVGGLLLLMLFSAINISRIGTDLHEIADAELPLTASLTEIVEHQLQQAVLFERALRYGASAEGINGLAAARFAKAETAFDELTRQVQQEIADGEGHIEKGLALVVHAEVRREFEKVAAELGAIEVAHAEYGARVDEVFALLKRGQLSEALRQSEAVAQQEDTLNRVLIDLLNEVERFVDHSMHAAIANEEAAMRGMWMTLFIGGPLALLAGYWCARRMSAQLKRAVTFAAQLARGDFTERLSASSRDEVGQLLRAMGQMSDSISGTVRDVMGSSMTLAGAAEQTSVATERANQSIAVQQSATEQVATAMNEMVATVSEISRSAANAAEAARKANQEAYDGKGVVAQSIEVIDGLSQEVFAAGEVIQDVARNSDEIGSVLDVIRDIAEQTNLLALNAAIEAARAGEQGRGFAVVADEVRTLAQRTQESTEEIQNMIERLQTGSEKAVRAMQAGREQARSSVEQARRAGASLEAITAAVNLINDMNAQIASAAEEQNAVAEEINRNINEITGVIDQTVHDAGETKAASLSVAEQAAQLQGMMARFRCA